MQREITRMLSLRTELHQQLVMTITSSLDHALTNDSGICISVCQSKPINATNN